MNIKIIRDDLTKHKGETLKFKFNGARNQIEEFEGEIVDTYPSIFIIRIQDETKQVKSFCYSDVLTESLEIIKTNK